MGSRLHFFLFHSFIIPPGEEFYPADVPPSSDVLHSDSCPADVPPSPDVSHSEFCPPTSHLLRMSHIRNSVRPLSPLLRMSHIWNSVRPTFHLPHVFHIRRLTPDGRGRFNFPRQTCPDPRFITSFFKPFQSILSFILRIFKIIQESHFQ